MQNAEQVEEETANTNKISNLQKANPLNDATLLINSAGPSELEEMQTKIQNLVPLKSP